METPNYKPPERDAQTVQVTSTQTSRRQSHTYIYIISAMRVINIPHTHTHMYMHMHTSEFFKFSTHSTRNPRHRRKAYKERKIINSRLEGKDRE